ncbi:MAG: YggT family protein [Sphingomonadales bacterium]|nr:YggT family protein [Sphingomonadales bacterium]MDE2169568.1 YggT family protein [Sphingomonadales bacterium]
MLLTLIDIITYVLNLISTLLIIYLVLSMLISFNVVNTYNQFVAAVWRGLSALFDPMLAPLRRVLPDTRPLDLSPMALIVLIRIAGIVLGHAATSVALQ